MDWSTIITCRVWFKTNLQKEETLFAKEFISGKICNPFPLNSPQKIKMKEEITLV